MSGTSGLLRLAFNLIDYAVDLTLSPTRFAHQHVESRGFAVGFLVTSITVAFLLLKAGMLALGLEAYSEVYYWIWTAPLILLFLACVTLGVQVGGLVSPVRVLHAFLYPYAVNLFVGSLIFAVAAATIRLLYAIEFIPDYHVDPRSPANFAIVLGNLYVECLAPSSPVVALILNLQHQHQHLMPPILYLPLVRSGIAIFYTATFALVLAAVLHRARWAMMLVVGVSGAITVGAIMTSNVYFFERYHPKSEPTCASQAYEQALEKTGSSRLQKYIEAGKFREKFTAADLPVGKVTDVRAEGKALVIYWAIDTATADPATLSKSAAEARERIKPGYCAGTYELLTEIGGSIVSVYRSVGGHHLETWSIGPDDCKR
jgi:hypothetical protein